MAATTTESHTGRKVALIQPETLGYTRLYLDFIRGRQTVHEFYPTVSAEQVAASLDGRDYPRGRLADILARQNEEFGLSDNTRASIDLLRNARSVCVFAGQQAGLFGGPLFTLIKALAIVKSARLFSERLGRPVVPVFWIAGDDHDFAEANHTYVLSRKGEIDKLEYQTRPSFPVPAAEIRFEDSQELTRVINQLAENLGQTDFTPALMTSLHRCYTPSDTLVTAFGKFMAALAGESGLVLFNPCDPEVKRLAVPFFEQVINHQEKIGETLSVTSERLRQNGYHVQVEKKKSAVHLFCNQHGRKAIMRDGDNFAMGDQRVDRSELASLLNEHPEIFSTDVMTRPLLQSSLFPTLIQIGGPSEIAYFAQVNPLFDLFHIPAPIFRARPTLTLLDRRSEQMMREMGIAFEDMLGDVEQVVNRVVAATFPADMGRRFASFRIEIERRFKELAEETVSFDSGLQNMAEQTRGKIDFLMNGLEAKVFAQHKKKSQETRERIYRLANTLYPQRVLQERCLNITYFLARYGAGMVKYILEHMNSEETAHQLLSLSEYEP